MKRILAALALAVSLVAALAQPADAATKHNQIRRTFTPGAVVVTGFGYAPTLQGWTYTVLVDGVPRTSGTFPAGSFDSGRLALGSGRSHRVEVEVVAWTDHGTHRVQVRRWTH